MGAFDIAIIVVICVAVAAVVGRLIYRKVKHKGGCCDCGCGSSACSSCMHNKSNTENEKSR